MDLRQMRYVVAIAECGTIRSAARSVHVTPQSLAQQVALVEREAGAPLFDRSPTGMVLTSVGEVFVAHATAALTQADHVLTATRAAVGALTPGPVRVAIAPGLTGVAGELFRNILVLHQDIDVRVVDMRTADQFDALHTGDITAGVGWEVLVPRAPRGLATQLLRSAPLHALLKRDDPLTTAPTVSLVDLAHAPLLLPTESKSPEFRQHLLDVFTAHQLDPRLGPATQSPEVAIASVAAGRGYALCVQSSILVPNDLTFVPIRESAEPMKIMLLTRRADRTPEATALRRAAQTVAKQR
ncbi:MAG: LysR family transcriptional regulator [Kutzneria sp.]|nr:LysR family transcriptional regulator [Kutzneria sp.]MBV9847647.1 LysR family transcriptional regulator [Kutzneria sp.]